MATTSCKISQIINYDFYHKIDTEPGSSGSPIISLKTYYVIGIHKAVNYDKNLNVGVFIGETINNLKRNNNKIFPKKENIINNINNVKVNNINNKKKVIIAIYDKKDDEIDLLCAYKCENIKLSFLEAKNNISENNIDIYVIIKK